MVEEPTSKNTKPQILAAYQSLSKACERLEAENKKLHDEKKGYETKFARAVNEARTAQSKAGMPKVIEKIDASSTFTIDRIIENLTILHSGFSGANSELSAKLTTEATNLNELREKAKSEIRQLEELHKLEINENTLDSLIHEYIEKSNLFEEQASQRRQAFEQEMAEKEKSWQKEQEVHTQLTKEREESTKSMLARDEAEYRYNLKLQRKLDVDQYELEQKALQKELIKSEELKKKEWAEHENIITEKENEFDECITKVEKFPKELDAAIKTARDEAVALSRRDTKIATDLRAKEIEGERRVAELKIKSLEEIIEKQSTQIQNLSAKFDSTLKQAQSLAMKAIEGASNVGSLEAMKQIALEQAKNVQKRQ